MPYYIVDFNKIYAHTVTYSRHSALKKKISSKVYVKINRITLHFARPSKLW